MHPILRRSSIRMLTGVFLGAGLAGGAAAQDYQKSTASPYGAAAGTPVKKPTASSASPYGAYGAPAKKSTSKKIGIGFEDVPRPSDLPKGDNPDLLPLPRPAEDGLKTPTPTAPGTPAMPGALAPSPLMVVPCPTGECTPENPWAKIPPVQPMPRLGGFIIPPCGPGYYSVWDFMRGRHRETAPKFPWAPTSLNANSFFNADFRYLEDPCNDQIDWLDRFKRIHVGDNFMFNVGGEFRYRVMDELNSRLTGVNNSYNLLRYRAYADAWYKDRVRLYGEFHAANTYGQELAPLLTDHNNGDILNLFTDLKVMDFKGAPIYVRAGRQELLFGSQRLVSPLDWVNSRRTFDGVRTFRHGENWDVDLFWARPVVPNAGRLDAWDPQKDFAGVWMTYKGIPRTTLDYYAMYLNDSNQIFVGRNGGGGSLDLVTLGSRAVGDIDSRFLYDFEAMLQLGHRANQNITAGSATAGVGYRAKSVRWNPTVWTYYDWASGTAQPGGPGSYTTFNHLFPFGHYYLGYLDLVGRQNIQAFHLQMSINPQPWITWQLQYHRFTLDQRADALYNAAGAPIRQAPLGNAGNFVGDQLDLICNVHITNHSDMLFGYSRLFPGSFIPNTGMGGPPATFYGQYSYKW